VAQVVALNFVALCEMLEDEAEAASAPAAEVAAHCADDTVMEEAALCYESEHGTAMVEAAWCFDFVQALAEVWAEHGVVAFLCDVAAADGPAMALV